MYANIQFNIIKSLSEHLSLVTELVTVKPCKLNRENMELTFTKPSNAKLIDVEEKSEHFMKKIVRKAGFSFNFYNIKSNSITYLVCEGDTPPTVKSDNFIMPTSRIDDFKDFRFVDN